jgi:RNA polymerase sigma-70 factor, ECF subfamily
MVVCANLSAVRPAAITTTFQPELQCHLLEMHRSVLETALNNPSTSADEAQLLARIARRDRQAFSQLYDRYSGILYATIFRVLNNADESNDVLQEVFVQIWDRAGAYDPALGKPFTWAMTLTRNKAIDRLRALKRRYSFMEELTLEMEAETRHRPFAGSELFSNDQSALVRAAVATLPLEQRQAIEMAFLGGLSQQEIAESLNQPLGTIKARIRRGMLRLREALKGLL